MASWEPADDNGWQKRPAMDEDSSLEGLAICNRSDFSYKFPSLALRTNSGDRNLVWSTAVSSERPQSLVASPGEALVHYDFRLAPATESEARSKQTDSKHQKNSSSRKKTSKTSQRTNQKGFAYTPDSCGDECTEIYARHSERTCRCDCRKHMFTAILQFNTKDETLAREIKRHLESITVQGGRVKVALMRDIKPTVSDTRKLDQLVDEETTTLYLILRTDNHDSSEQTYEITRRIKDFVIVPFDVVQIFSGDGVVKKHSDTRLKEVNYRMEDVEEFFAVMKPILQHALTTVITDGKGIAQRERCEARMNRSLSDQQVSDQDLTELLHRSNTLPRSLSEGSPHVKKRFAAKMQHNATRQPLQESQYDADNSSLSNDFRLGGRIVNRRRESTPSSANPVSLQADTDSMGSTEASHSSSHSGRRGISNGQVPNHLSVTSEDKRNQRWINEIESSSDDGTRKNLNNHSDDNAGASNMNSESHPNPHNLHSLKKGNTVTSENSKIIMNIDLSGAKTKDRKTQSLNINSKDSDSDKLESYNKRNLSPKERDSNHNSCPDKQQLQVHRPVGRIGPSRREVQTEYSQSELEETTLKTFHSINEVFSQDLPRHEQNIVTSDSGTLNENTDQESSDPQPKRAGSHAETENENPEVGITEGPLENANREASVVLAMNIPSQEADGLESSACSTESLMNPATNEQQDTSVTLPASSHEDDTQQQQGGRQGQLGVSRRLIGTLRRLGRRLARGARFLSCSSRRTSRENS